MMINKINNFVEAMLDAQQKFENIQGEITRCESMAGEIIESLKVKQFELVENVKNEFGSNDASEVMEVFEKVAKNFVNKTNNAIEKIDAAREGMKFIQDFEKHFNVAVFGKVKAGKSYIGNFVMGNLIKKTGVTTKYDELKPITVQVYDRGKILTQNKLSEQPEDDGFATGMEETTSAIQWFDLGGISWFDTPGIGSVTWENEMLAKEYVVNADLVIFACNSDAAGTRQEFAEMRQLYNEGKPILLLLTQSDTCDYDFDEDGQEISILVAKNEKDRRDTEEYMKQTLAEQGISDLLKYDILTVSAKLALEALETGNEKLFEESNMGDFLDRLIAITRNDSAEMKRKTPKNRINVMVDGVIKDLEEMSFQIKEICESMAMSRRDLEGKKKIFLSGLGQWFM